MTPQEVSIVSAARAALLDPPRRDFVVKNATVPDAIRAIKDAYGWDVQELSEECREFLKDVRISIALHNASKMECIAALCNQTSLYMYQDTGYISIFGAIGQEETGGRNHAFADSGLCFLLSFDEDGFSDKNGRLVYGFRLALVSDVKWFGVGNPALSCDITKFVYPDGSTPHVVTGSYMTASDIFMFGLAKNKGVIKEINMRVVVGIPDAVKRITVDLADLKPGCETNHGGAYLRIDKFAKQEDGWLLDYATGYCERKGVIQNAGIITVLGPDGSPMTGDGWSSGCRGGSDEAHGDFSEDTEEVFFSQKPSQLIWMFPASVTEETYEVRFRDVRVPPIVWEKQQRYFDVTAGMKLDEILKLMIMSDEADRRTAALHSLPTVTDEEHIRYLADVKREEGERRAFAVHAVGQAAPRLEKESDRQSVIRLLLSLLDDPDPVIVGLSLQGLIAMGRHVHMDDVSRVVALLKAKEPWLRRLSASLLGSAQVPSDRMFEPLLLAVSDASPGVCAAAATSLSVNLPRINAKQLAAVDLVGPLVGALRLEDEGARRASAAALGAMGRLAVPAFGELLTVAKGADKETSKAAIIALLQICGLGDLSESYGFSDLPISRELLKDAAEKPITEEMLSDVRTLVIKRLGSPEDQEREDAIKTFRKFRILPPEAMDQLRTLASKDEHRNVRREAIEALGALAKEDKDAKTIAVLLEIAHSENSSDADRALELLADIGVATDKVIPLLIAILETNDKDHDPLSVARVLAKYRSEAMPFLIKALKSDTAKVRQTSARAMTDIVSFGDYLGARGRPDAASGGLPLLDALQVEKDASVQGSILEAILKVLPDSKQAVPILLRVLPTVGVEQQKMAVDALAAYEKDASEAVPVLLTLLHRSTDEELRCKILEALKSIGMSRTIAESVSEMQVLGTYVGAYALDALCPYPDLALRFLERHNGILSQFHGWNVATLKSLLAEKGPEYKSLQERILADPNLPISLMLEIGRPEYLGFIQKRIAATKDDPHHVTQLRAAARALGAKPDRVVKISKQDAGSFKPKSAWPDTDASRVSPNGRGHGDGLTPVIITGALVMKDGSPAVNPAFYNTNDRMLLGEATRDRAEVKYDAKTGRFVFQTEVFAAYSMGEGKRAPGPYQTGSALVLIEADGAEPLTVRFFDEMPDVEITLEAGPGHTAVKKDILKAKEDTSQGESWGSMPEPQMP